MAGWLPVVSGNTSANTSFCHTVFVVVAIYKYVLFAWTDIQCANELTHTHTVGRTETQENTRTYALANAYRFTNIYIFRCICTNSAYFALFNLLLIVSRFVFYTYAMHIHTLARTLAHTHNCLCTFPYTYVCTFFWPSLTHSEKNTHFALAEPNGKHTIKFLAKLMSYLSIIEMHKYSKWLSIAH